MSEQRMTTDDYLRTPETVMPKELAYGLVREAAAPTPDTRDGGRDLYPAGALEEHRVGGSGWQHRVVLDRER
jgi:hypothetical protein